jgi:hypothetical protein
MRDVYQIRKILVYAIKKPGFYPDFNNLENMEKPYQGGSNTSPPSERVGGEV